VKTTQIQAGNKKESPELLIYSVREKREQKYGSKSEKRMVHSMKRQGRGGVRRRPLHRGIIVPPAQPRTIH
jgi:hypothetical protein